MRKAVLLIAVVVVLGVGAYFGFSTVSNKGLKEGLDQALATLPPGWAVTYGSADVGLASNSITLKGVEIHGTGTTKVDAKIGEIDLTGPALDLAQNWARARANPAALAPDKAIAVANAITLKGVTVHSDKQDAAIGSVHVDKIRLYPWALLHDGVPGYGEVLGMARLAHPPEAGPALAEDMLPVLRWEAAVLLGFGVDSYSVEGVTGAAEVDRPGEAAVRVAYAAKNAHIDHLDRGKLALATIEAMTANGEPALDFAVDHVTMAGLDAQSTLTRVLSGAALDPAMLDGMALDKLDYAGLRVKTPSGAPVSLGEIAVSNIAFAHGSLTSGDFAVKGVKLDKAQLTDDQALDAFDKLGLETATVSVGGGYRWNVDKKTATLNDVNLTVDELGTITLSADLAGIDTPETMEQTASLNHAVLRYNDASLAERAIKAAAAQSGVDPAQFRLILAGMAQMQSAALGKGPDIAAAGKAIGAFLADPHNLTIELAPPQPVPLITMQADKDLPPQQIFAKLGIKVTANQ
jgi:hypothetical protein